MCSGYGGASAGMIAAGLDIKASYDVWPVAVNQHRVWHPEVPCSLRDVSTITPDELAGRFVWASLPCQPYSMANVKKDTRGRNHPHYYPLAHFARQVQHARVALIENVPGLVWSQEGRAEMLDLEQECSRLGLTMSVHLISSQWFGVAQKRQRVFVLIGRNLPLLLIQPGTFTAPKSSSVTCHSGGDNIHSARKVKLAASVLASEGRGRTGDFASAAGAGRTIEECAALQGVPVPPDHLTKQDRYKLVGNCVPPRLAEAISRQVFR